MGRTASNVRVGISLLLILGLGALWYASGQVRHVVTLHGGTHYFLVEEFNGAVYITRTPERDFSIGQFFESPEGSFVGVKTTSIYWHAVTLGIPYWLVMLALSILPIRKAWGIIGSSPRMIRRRIAVLALMVLVFLLCSLLTPHLN